MCVPKRVRVPLDFSCFPVNLFCIQFPNMSITFLVQLLRIFYLIC